MRSRYSFALAPLVVVAACGNEHWSFDDRVEDPVAGLDAAADGAPLQCAEGETRCGELCANVLTAPSNCGICGVQCESGTVCDLGECHPACRAGRVECDGACLDVDKDDQGCGGCGMQCVAPQKCRGGLCR